MAVLVVVMSIALAACDAAEEGFNEGLNGKSSSETKDDGKFSQTWKKGYAETTCQEWAVGMTDNERRIAAADMLTSARHVDKHENLPSDTLIDDFKQNVSTACEGDAGQKITDIASGVYLIDKEHWLR